jgi:hypothetical protein
MAKVFSLDISCDFDFLGKVIRKSGTFTVVLSAGDRRAVDICLTLITSKPRFTNPSERVLCRSWDWKMLHHSLYRLLGLGMEGEMWEVIALKVRMDG